MADNALPLPAVITAEAATTGKNWAQSVTIHDLVVFQFKCLAATLAVAAVIAAPCFVIAMIAVISNSGH